MTKRGLVGHRSIGRFILGHKMFFFPIFLNCHTESPVVWLLQKNIAPLYLVLQICQKNTANSNTSGLTNCEGKLRQRTQMDFSNRESTYLKIGPDVSHTLKRFAFLSNGTLSGNRRKGCFLRTEGRKYVAASCRYFWREKKKKHNKVEQTITILVTWKSQKLRICLMILSRHVCERKSTKT